MTNIFPIDFEEKNTMAPDDYVLFSDSEDGNKIKKAQYQNLKGEKGDTGTAATITVGSTTTGAAGSSASVTNSGTSSAAVLDFTIPKGDKGDTGQTGPAIVSAAFNGNDIDFTEEDGNVVTLTDAKIDLKGDKGDAATVSVGTTSTLPAGSSATVTNSGTSSAAVFNFGIPKGDKGDTGNTGATGNGIASITSSKVGKTTTVTITETNGNSDSFTVEDGADGQGSGDVIGPASSTDGNVVLFNGATGKLIKDSGKALPGVVDNLTSSSTTDALSANQGSVLKGMIDDLSALGKFLSLWDSTTGQPISFPLSTPYTYTTGDYFLVETVSSATPPVNYKPTGSSYTGTASSTTESDELEVGDVYIYDGTTWLLQSNHGKTVAFSNIAGNPEDNTALDNALDAKQDSLTLPATPTQGHLVTWGADNKTLADGGAIPTTPSKATSSALGTIKLGSDTVQSASAEAVSGTANRTYAIQLNSSDQAVVNVPRTDTTYTTSTGLVPTTGTTNYVLTKTADGYGWATAPVTSVNGQTGAVTGLLTAETVVSGVSGTTYTIKVSNSAPGSGTPNTTITFVTA